MEEFKTNTIATEKLKLDHQRMTATVSLDNEQPLIVIVDQSKARVFELPDYGDLVVKVSDGKVQLIDVSEKHKF